jgi:hypothetical protein
MPKRLSHDETLRWIAEHRAWRVARKTKPIWARAVAAEEIGRAFRSADHTTQRPQSGAWLCVGSAGEPWFQSKAKIDAKYRHDGEEQRRFDFDDGPRAYHRFVPDAAARSWAAQVTAPDIEGFYIGLPESADRPLYSPAGGYVVTDYVDDPYGVDLADVWLVQQSLFEDTYEIAD